jgi:prepilin-type N-terminal cleavage/methylation domain-containing protein/prepilin-type processing-associated H-X9-DG protein
MRSTPLSPRTGLRSGFTLIELLTVIAIIGVLAAIIIPTVGKVRETARQTQGLSNIRQLASIGQVYAADNRGMLPSDFLADKNGRQYWWHLLESYLSTRQDVNHEIFLDPSISTKWSEVKAQFIPNSFVAPDAGFANSPWQRTYTLNTVRTPSSVIYLADGIIDPTSRGQGGTHASMWRICWNAPANGVNPPSTNANLPIPTQDVTEVAQGDGDIAYRASGNKAAKVAFVDGHVAVMKKGEIQGRHINPAFTN